MTQSPKAEAPASTRRSSRGSSAGAQDRSGDGPPGLRPSGHSGRTCTSFKEIASASMPPRDRLASFTSGHRHLCPGVSFVPRLRHRFILLALMAVSAIAAAVPSSAAVQVRVGVRPDTLVHCGRGLLNFALWNDGEDPLRVKVYVSITHEDTTEIGPRVFRAPLEPHQLVRREATFFVPPLLPTGRYALRVLAVASDSS